MTLYHDVLAMTDAPHRDAPYRLYIVFNLVHLEQGLYPFWYAGQTSKQGKAYDDYLGSPGKTNLLRPHLELYGRDAFVKICIDYADTYAECAQAEEDLIASCTEKYGVDGKYNKYNKAWPRDAAEIARMCDHSAGGRIAGRITGPTIGRIYGPILGANNRDAFLNNAARREAHRQFNVNTTPVRLLRNATARYEQDKKPQARDKDILGLTEEVWDTWCVRHGGAWAWRERWKSVEAWDDTQAIIVAEHGNPKKPNTQAYQAYELLKQAKTVGELRTLLEASGLKKKVYEEISWALAKGYITLGPSSL
jgi:hypothetical protein